MRKKAAAKSSSIEKAVEAVQEPLDSRIGFYVSDNEHMQLKQQALNERTTISDIVRRSIKTYLSTC